MSSFDPIDPNYDMEAAMKTEIVITTPHPRPTRQGVADIYHWAIDRKGVELSFLDCINLCIDPRRGVSLTDIAEYILSAVNEEDPRGNWYQLTDEFDIEVMPGFA
tara:strand:- start:832 stop:1146 length:315 start_codon:yes stop_codon:yes gene_type:complete